MFELIETSQPIKVWQFLKWWGVGWMAYNVLLLAFFIITYIGIDVVVSPHLAPGEDVIEPMALIFVILPAYFGTANLCYGLTGIGELLIERFLGQNWNRYRSRLYWGFVVISAGITSLPFWYVCFIWWVKPLWTKG